MERAMNCPKCGEQFTEGAAFCWSCEAALDNLLLPPTPARPPRSGDQETPPNSQAGKNQEILALGVFMMGVLWSCGATAASQEQGYSDYIWPVVLMVVGVLIWIGSKLKSRRHVGK